ncbi:MAG: sel1 repeat family protein [Candidatus Obscuribacterales bacterium]|nr:sel1 repeat family protein [Candidatus Obscuribacterales bacterium]
MRSLEKNPAIGLLIISILSCANNCSVKAQSSTTAGKETFEQGIKLYQSGNISGALSKFKQAGEQGDPRGFTQLGFQYESGDGVAQNYELAAQFYSRAAQSGEELGMKNLGKLYEDGKGVNEDWLKAAYWYRKAADKGYADAEAALARAYQFGIGVPQSRANAIDWDKKAMAHGNKDSAYWVRWLSNPLNYIRFRNDQEQELVMGNQLRTSSEFLGGDPAGQTFKNSAERISWLRGFRKKVDFDEAKQRQDRERWSQEYHESEVRRLEREGYSHSEAERKAGR